MVQLGYVVVGTNDLERAIPFYDALFTKLGCVQTLNMKNRIVVWGPEGGPNLLMLTRPANREAATVGNGMMVALQLDSQAQVEEMHAFALSLGVTNEGDPGVRLGGLYCGYFRDPDSNKFNFHCTPEG